MARVKTFPISQEWGVPDGAIANFITDCEEKHYVNVRPIYVEWPTPRVTIIVTKLDEKDPSVIQDPHQEDDPSVGVV